METCCSTCGVATDGPDLCAGCAGLLRWIRGYFAHIPDLPPKITPETRFVGDLGVDSLDWMYRPPEAEEELGVVLSDWQLERTLTVGQFILASREAGAEWPDGTDVRLAPRPRWWSPYRRVVAGSVEGQASGGNIASP